MPEKTYTTYQIADICDVYPSSVIDWINNGRLKAYLTPGGHHRIVREDLLAFLQAFKVPIPKELQPGPKRILIVDDDPEVRRVLEKAFARHQESFKVETCDNGVEALIQIGQAPPDLVLLDIVLPKMDGFQVCTILKAKPETRNIKIIAVSGKKAGWHEKSLAEHKIDAFFRKPLDLTQLVEKAAELLKTPLAAAVRK